MEVRLRELQILEHGIVHYFRRAALVDEDTPDVEGSDAQCYHEGVVVRELESVKIFLGEQDSPLRVIVCTRVLWLGTYQHDLFG